MTRIKFALNQNNDYATIKGKKYFLDKNVYNYQKRYRLLALAVMLMATMAIFKLMKHHEINRIKWLFIMVIITVVVSTVLHVLLLPKNINKYITEEE